MTNKQIARSLKIAADLIELTGGNAFRARAYGAASRTVNSLEEPLVTLARGDKLVSMRGIGASIADDIVALIETGSFDTLDELVAAVPPGLLDVLRIRGLGPRKVRTLWEQLGVIDLDGLSVAATEGRIGPLAGFGSKSAENIIREIDRIRSYSGLFRYATAIQAAKPLLEAFRSDAWIDEASFAGALRRGFEVVSEVEIVVSGDEDAVRAILTKHTSGEHSEGQGGLSRLLPGDIPVRVHIVETDHVIGLWRHTGSEAHVQAVERSAPLPPSPSTEADIYAAAGLQFVPPELREGDSAIAAARSSSLPRLIEVSDLRGVIHNHTTASDGVHTLREMADEARTLGFEYLGICDHSRSLAIANGLTIERLMRQAEEIADLNAELAAESVDDFVILHGSEVDILADGSLDFPDEVLADLDLVVASIHSRFEMTEEEATDRLLNAIANPFTDILGHPTGRLLLSRDGYPIDHDAIIEACALHQVAIELNANPYRLDMDWRHIRKAVESGVMISINPDAHSTEELSYSEWGVAVARKGWLTREACLNALALSDFRNWIDHRRKAPRAVASAE